ncbi:MAG TPA: DJ-1/PfpI family protein [Acidisoma sp.]|jgi:transcriptional regulator GlxA family with amidase domain|uniref:GlxA family transcriptional regulator n=1 Tax=Acidisoma sp. TaxID=1872115 RepID=UPI002CCE0796|nr:DJ-1/PfpI family protein [Acidisoma sp.]HTI00566.1 DJ-1/PfpI family protein [Acidisoma sp.]
MQKRRIAVLALPGVQLLDVSGPLDVFAEANVQAGFAAYELTVIATAPGPIASSSGVRLIPDEIVGEGTEERVDTLLVAGCPHADKTEIEASLIAWLRAKASQARRYGSVCSGAFALAAAGLLDGVRVTTHWAVAEILAARYPAVLLEEDAIYLRDGRVRTAAGVTAGLDLALALVEEDLGREIAMAVAAQLVMFFKRPGGQLQFSRRGEAAPAGRAALQEVQRWVAAYPALDHSVSALAERMKVSPRHFARMFRADLGMTPAVWVEMARVEAARRLLEEGRQMPKQVAAACGFADADVLRRAFLRRVGVTPAEYRRRHGGGSSVDALAR